MRITTDTNTNFTSRNLTIRQAEEIGKRVNNAFPMQSSSKFRAMRKDSDDIFVHLAFKNLNKKIKLMRDYLIEKGEQTSDFVKKFQIYTSSIRKNKVGNCAESATLTAVAAKANGIKGAYVATLASGNKHIDHDVVFINAEKPYIIDTWLGFADYEQNAIKRWQGEYKKFLNAEDSDLRNIRVVRHKDIGCPRTTDKELTSAEINNLKELYPEYELGDMISAVESACQSISNAMFFVCAIFVTCTILITVLIIFLLVRMKLTRERVMLGVDKALGFTTGQLIKRMIMNFLPVVIREKIIKVLKENILTT